MKHLLAVLALSGATAAGLGLPETQMHWHGLIGPVAAQHGPAQMRSELENESLQVLRIHLAPHEKTGMHDVSPRLVVWLTDAHIRDTKEDGTTEHYQRAAGAIEWLQARRHAGENLSGKPVEFLAIIPKSAPAALTGHQPEQH
jgi:hypothetical protein